MESSFLEFVTTKMQPVSGKAILSDLVLAKHEMPDAQLSSAISAVPDCITDDNGEINPDRLAILAWIQLRREDPDITQDKVVGLISLADGEVLMEFLKRIYWFWSDLSKEEFEKRWQVRMDRVEELRQALELTPEESEPEEEVAPENPTLSESS